MKIIILESSSKGNSSLIDFDEKRILIDMGIGYTKLKEQLKKHQRNLNDLDLVLITHNHIDHVRGLETFLKKEKVEVFTSNHIKKTLKNEVFGFDEFLIKDNLTIKTINLSHDTLCVGYIIKYKEEELVYITDTGYIDQKYLKELENKKYYLIESNYNDLMLMEGDYPFNTKRRIASDEGHLSNNETGYFLSKVLGNKTKAIVLMHLSENNNKPELAYQDVYNFIKRDDILYVSKEDLVIEVDND